jgi:hypothetical protein
VMDDMPSGPAQPSGGVKLYLGGRPASGSQGAPM